MILKTCIDCKHNSIKEESSFCAKEGCFSYLTNCIKHKALEAFLHENVMGKA